MGLDTDATSLPDLDDFRDLFARSFEEVIEAATQPAGRPDARSSTRSPA